MARIIERNDSRGGEFGTEKRSRTLSYIVKLDAGENELDAIAAVRSEAPTFLDGLIVQTIRWTPKENGIFEFEVPYANIEPAKAPNKPPKHGQGDDGGGGIQSDGDFSFDTTGGKEKVYYSLKTVANFGVAGATAPDFQGAINVSKSGIGGIDVDVPTFKFSINKKFALGDVDGAYIRTLFLLTGRTNNKAYSVTYQGVKLDFEERELIFKGARGAQRGAESWDFNFSFEGLPNVANLKIGSSQIGSAKEPDRVVNLELIEGEWFIPSKKGTDYLWVNFQEEEDTDTKTLVDRPRSAHIERVHRDADFKLLRL